jgi:hypothetical protein
MTRDELIEKMVNLSEGIIGATTVITQLYGEEMDGLVYLVDLEEQDIKGSSIWIAYKDICGCDINKMKIDLRSGDLKKELAKSSRR